jgi:ParB family chromosome partitioning protein
MPVDIEAVLALLPEMFPGAQPIPLKNIRPNPENPGPPLTDQAIQELADNMAGRGLVNSVKIQPDKTDPLAGGVKLHPDNPRLTADGRPWALGDFNFMLLAGERRYRAADRLKWATLSGFILNPTEEEAVEITHLDNDVRERGWWAGYQSIEQLIKANPNLTQRQIGTRLKMDKDKVNRAFRFLPLLNPEARALIVCITDNSNKGIWGISERAADWGPIDDGLKEG